MNFIQWSITIVYLGVLFLANVNVSMCGSEIWRLYGDVDGGL